MAMIDKKIELVRRSNPEIATILRELLDRILAVEGKRLTTEQVQQVKTSIDPRYDCE